MIALPHGCRCSDLKVHPDNWTTTRASLKDTWYIQFRFYDAAGKSKQVIIKGMNRSSTLADRVKETKKLLNDWLHDLKSGYNPITYQTIPEFDTGSAILPTTPFIKALTEAADLLKCAKATVTNVKNVIGTLTVYAIELRIDNIPVCSVRRAHIKQLLEFALKRRELSASSYNHYRAYLMMLFRELLEVEAVDTNPVTDIRKLAEVAKIRKTLTIEERKIVDQHLKKAHYAFWRYLHIFYQSGARSSELLRLQGKDVNLEGQYYVKTILKGRSRKQVHAIIKNVALPYWNEAMATCKPEDFIFSRGLVPGPKPILYERVTKL